ncbi:MAG: hypothetical protein Q9194_004328 [Teloschistes cf. exilis]
MEKTEGASAAGSSAMDVDVNPKDGPLYTNFADAVDAIIMDLPARTRAKTKVVRRNAIEAGIVAPAESSKTAAASEADSDVFEEDEGLQDFGGTGVDNLAWNAWEKAQGAIIAKSISPIVDYVRQLQSKPRQTLRVVRSFMADLHYRYDDADDMESPRTFDVQWKHWQEFDTMITALMDQGKGREMAYIKIEVPLEAFSAAKGRYHRDDVQLQTHRLQLKPLSHHGQFDNRGVYRVTLSKTFKGVSSDVWRVIMKDYEIETGQRRDSDFISGFLDPCPWRELQHGQLTGSTYSCGNWQARTAFHYPAKTHKIPSHPHPQIVCTA